MTRFTSSVRKLWFCLVTFTVGVDWLAVLLVLVLGVFALDWTMTEMSNWRRDFDRREELRQRDFYREIDRVVEEIESSSLAAPAVSEQVSE